MLTKKIIQEVLGKIVDACRTAPLSTMKVIVFGSVARNDFDLDSDIDILVVSTNPSESKHYFGNIADELFTEYYVPISILYVTPERLKMGDRFIRNIINEGKTIWESKKMK